MNNSISKIAHNDCTGCAACRNKCPKNAISMEYDSEGFLFPVVSNDCVNCGLCLKVCPVEQPLTHYETPPSYAVWAEDDVRRKSSSGGMFSILADYVFKQNGVVCGAAYADDYQTVYHQWATKPEELAPLRGSKYVQSEIRLTYREAKAYLDEGRVVLYTGCPCQIAGLYNYLGKEYPNLYTADIVCHGSNSVFAYQSFLREFTEGKPIECVNFRDKKYYQWSTPTVVYLKDGTVKKYAWNESTWNIGFLNGIFNRKNCNHCSYACAERIADITLADCWQVHRINPKYDDRIGTSLVLVNSPKGKDLFERLKPTMKLCEPVPLAELRKYNGQLNRPATSHPCRQFFFEHLLTDGYHKALWYGRGMRFDVGIVGWWFASNFGSSLTYYALATVLQQHNKQVLFVPIGKPDGTPWEPEIKQTVDFISKHFKVGRNRPFDRMGEFNQFCDAFMLGSDQMWTPGTTNLLGYTFFLDFVDKDKRKIAYSTSFGHDTFAASDEVRATAGDFLKRFTAISVREESGVRICKDTFGVDAQLVFDPVFLLSAAEYNVIAQDPKLEPNTKYLLCYILDPTPEKEQIAKEIAERNGLEVLTVFGIKEYTVASEKWHTGRILPRMTSEQFLGYVKHADFVFTDSHHGTCFAIIYQRQYLAFVNASRGATRFLTVANLLGLTTRLIYSAEDANACEFGNTPIAYDAVEQKLGGLKMSAIEWLIQAFKVPVKEGIETINTAREEGRREGAKAYLKKPVPPPEKKKPDIVKVVELPAVGEFLRTVNAKNVAKTLFSSIFSGGKHE